MRRDYFTGDTPDIDKFGLRRHSDLCGLRNEGVVTRIVAVDLL